MAFSLSSYSQQRVVAPYQKDTPGYIQPYLPKAKGQRVYQGRRIEQIKELYIARKLNLSPRQSKAFWPLYRQYIREQTAVRILKRENNSANSPNGTEQIDKELQYETELVNIRKHYRDEFLRILTPAQLSELYKSERAFNDEAVRILGERMRRSRG